MKNINKSLYNTIYTYIQLLILYILEQAPTVNQKTWKKAEMLERIVAVSLGTVNVLNGVIYTLNPERIGKNQIAVPSAFWKMIYNDEKDYKKCFYYENDLNAKSKSDKLKNHQVDCDKLKEHYINEYK